MARATTSATSRVPLVQDAPPMGRLVPITSRRPRSAPFRRQTDTDVHPVLEEPVTAVRGAAVHATVVREPAHLSACEA